VAFVAVLDACVLYPFSLRDTLLRLAERELYVARWSDRILEEVRRNLVEERLTDEQAANLLDAMRDFFPEAGVDTHAIERIEGAMTNDPKDRHVLAAAVVARAEGVVTFNLGDFPEEACAPYGVEALHPDMFMMTLHEIAPAVAAQVVSELAADLTNPPIPRDELIESLRRAGVPQFAAAIADG
jgi:predicted nucleic acid-binding protein